TGNVCVTDDEGLSMCAPFVAEVANQAPRVDAGPDIAVGAVVALSDITFQDPGPFDTHTATIDWDGDGPGAPEQVPAGDIAATRGGGTITAAHTFIANGPTEVRVCVTDNVVPAVPVCDVRTLDVRLANVTPVASLLVEEAVEGDVVDVGIGITDANVDEDHTITVDWGDASAPEQPAVAQSLVGCSTNDPVDFDHFDPNDIGTNCGLTASASPTHVYADNGAYTVSVGVCDSDGGCDTTSEVLTITNAAPTVTVADPLVQGQVVDVSGTYSDRSSVDTHHLTVDWGDSASSNPALTGGTFEASHTYSGTTTAASIQMCVVDDDGGSTCVTRNVTLGSVTPKIPFLVSLTPARVLETRDMATIDGGFRNLGPLVAGSTIEVQVTGRGGVPASGVDAAVLNVAAVQPAGNGFLTIYPCGAFPNASSLNFTTGVNIPNEIIAKLSPAGTVCIFTSATTGLIADVVGYVPAGSEYRSLTPARVLETRDMATIDGGFRNLGPLVAGSTIEVQVTGRGGVPASGVDAAVLNVAAVQPAGNGFLTIYPCGAFPNASSLNFTTGVNIPNEIIAKLSPAGTVCIFTSATTGLIADVVGYIPAS
ncbi:MAG TPA: hypothetical protein PLS63_10580, partial [Microthrixaceae bacterium]|nr:hypothetical protein [Microthrixaceae bacterium]